jgi:hypothetical protein
MTLKSFAASLVPVELLAAYDDPEREAVLASLDAAAATVSPERDRVVAQRALVILRAVTLKEVLRHRGCRYPC